jgi:hypothetical protein
MTLQPQEFMRRFLLHVLPEGLHRIRHYGLLANGCRKASLATARELLQSRPGEQHQATAAANEDAQIEPCARQPTFVCRRCGRPMTILETFVRGQSIRAPPSHGAAT